MKANVKIARFVSTIDKLDREGKKVAGLIMSHAGLGKTSTMRMYCDCMDYNLYTLIPSAFANDDILGLQTVTKSNQLVRLTPSWFDELTALASNGKRTLLFIDELSTCDAYLQSPLLDLIFSRRIGKNTLPNNVFIVSSGNYSEDLNGEFKMFAPMVNRFVLLNISKDDISLDEIINRDYEKLITKEEKKAYLGIDNPNGSSYSYKAFERWAVNDNEISFGGASSSEVKDVGLVGFTSVRSLDFSMKFAEAYLSLFDDDYWLSIVGDTLGYSNVRPNILMRNVLYSDENKFFERNTTNESLTDLCKEALSKGKLTNEILGKIEVLFKSIKSSNDLTDEDKQTFTDMALTYSKVEGMGKILNLYTNLCK